MLGRNEARAEVTAEPLKRQGVERNEGATSDGRGGLGIFGCMSIFTNLSRLSCSDVHMNDAKQSCITRLHVLTEAFVQ